MPQRSGRDRIRILGFWEKHGLTATMDAFKVSRRTLFLWKRRLKQGDGKFKAFSNSSRAPKNRRKQSWPEAVVREIVRLRSLYPTLGKRKIYRVLEKFCFVRNLPCPKPTTIGRLLQSVK